MHLERLELLGFRDFPDTSFALAPPGVPTFFVGPTASGKSRLRDVVAASCPDLAARPLDPSFPRAERARATGHWILDPAQRDFVGEAALAQHETFAGDAGFTPAALDEDAAVMLWRSSNRRVKPRLVSLDARSAAAPERHRELLVDHLLGIAVTPRADALRSAIEAVTPLRVVHVERRGGQLEPTFDLGGAIRTLPELPSTLRAAIALLGDLVADGIHRRRIIVIDDVEVGHDEQLLQGALGRLPALDPGAQLIATSRNPRLAQTLSARIVPLPLSPA